MSAVPPTTAADALIDVLVSAPRLSRVVAVSADRIVVRVDVPQPADNRMTPQLVVYVRSGTGWAARAAVAGTHACLIDSGDLLYVRSAGARSQLRLLRAEAADELVLELPGSVGDLTASGPDGAVAATVRSHAGRRAQGPLAGADAAWWDGPGASVGAARRRESPWRVWVGPAKAPAELQPVDSPGLAGHQLTGEAAWAASGLVLGTVSDQVDGRRRFGLIHLGPDGDVRATVHPRYDLSAPVGRADGGVACVGTLVPRVPEEHLAQVTCLVDDADTGPDAVRVLEGPPGLWWQPRGWTADGTLLLTAEDGARRVLHAATPGAPARAVAVDGSVLDVACAEDVVAALVSAPDLPPRLAVGTVGADGRLRLAEADDPEPQLDLPGTARWYPFEANATRPRLGAWVCQPPPQRRRHGLVVFFHGGPLKSWTDWPWRWNPWPYVAAGFTVALVEPPMSLGFGDEAIAAGWREWRTGIAAIAAEQVRELADTLGLATAPLALMGGSFGGYLSLATAAELRPRLVVAHGPPADVRYIAASSDVGWQWIREYGDPVTSAADYADQALPDRPVSAGTRVLLSHGLADDLVPVTESVRLHRAMLTQGVRSELAVFRDEGHPVLRPHNLGAWFRWVAQACEAELGATGEGVLP